jgi:DNA-binding NarL/FixJ family response regulator
MGVMKIRLLIATPDTESKNLLHSLVNAAMQMVPLDIEISDANKISELVIRSVDQLDDLLLLDWQLAGAETPNHLRDLLALNPKLRVIALLPLQLRQYRQCLWQVGACSSIPKEYLDQEWLLSVLCLISRAMEREERLRESLVRN